ncbi:F0F1 ATP synthase subunit epsilon [Candidatus Kapabacteria bacterium]|nr:F0F1 ATP synthase subunit epsilon [Candidatus Kapabacteria bacterium]
MSDKLNLEIITPSSVAFKGEADMVSLPGSKSPFQVLNNHAPIVTSLEDGVLSVRNGSEETVFNTTKGFAEINKNVISVLVEKADIS